MQEAGGFNSNNNNNSSEHKSGESAIVMFLVKASGVFLILNVTLLNKFILRIYSEHLYCNQ